VQKQEKKPKFSFQELKTAATSINAAARKQVFLDYFEMFEEFPSYLFDNEHRIDPLLSETIEDIKKDPATSDKMQRGIVALLQRLPSSI
jgi:hypothetical protein